jgi:uncharacterized SAM-binding protein YcdF (DUF218 family)
VVACAGAGRLIIERDPLQHADAIYVLGGTRLERALEAADLYREGIAPHILISNGNVEPADFELASRGITVRDTAETARALLIEHLGVPPDAVEALNEFGGSSAEELRDIAPIVSARHYTSLIVITNRTSTRRIGVQGRRVLGPNVHVIAWASRRDSFDVWGWWRTRDGVKQVFYELPKLAVYAVGLGG